MSALPPKADIETQSRDVRFVPKADIPANSLVPAVAPMPGHARDGHDGYQHYSKSHGRHDASVWDTPQAAHSNVKSSGNPPNRAVRRISRIGCAHFGQRGGGGAGLVTHSSEIRTFLTSANMSLFPDRSHHRQSATFNGSRCLCNRAAISHQAA